MASIALRAGCETLYLGIKKLLDEGQLSQFDAVEEPMVWVPKSLLVAKDNEIKQLKRENADWKRKEDGRRIGQKRRRTN